MEERLDNLNADFSTQCRREMTLKDSINDLEKEISEQQSSKVILSSFVNQVLLLVKLFGFYKKFLSERVFKTRVWRAFTQKTANVKETTAKLNEQRTELAALKLKIAKTSEAIDVTQQELLVKEGKLNTRKVHFPTPSTPAVAAPAPTSKRGGKKK